MTPAGPRLWTFSDLHQEWPGNAWDPAAHAPPDGFDVAVVAGDVHMPLTRALDWLAERLPGVPVVYVPGNHDFWWDRGEDRYTLADLMSRGRDVAARHGIHLLLDDAVVIGGTRFAGGTLWTDFRHGSTTLTQAMRSAQAASAWSTTAGSAPARVRGTGSSPARCWPCTDAPALSSMGSSRNRIPGPRSS